LRWPGIIIEGVVDVFPLKATVHETSERVVGKPEVIPKRASGNSVCSGTMALSG